MADFEQAFQRVIVEEGGFVLTNSANDRGGQTYAGISRRAHPQWPGWAFVDRGEEPPTQLVRDLYSEKFWTPVQGDQIAQQDVAEAVYTFAVNAGVKTASILAQAASGAVPDGKIGPKSLEAINKFDPQRFRERFALAMITRYRDICVRDKTQRKWIIGWINRALKVAA